VKRSAPHGTSRVAAGAITVAEDPIWGHYAETILEIHAGECVSLDLRQPLSQGARDRLVTLGLGEPFAVITACNPLGRTVDGRQNRRRTKRLRTALDARGFRWVSCDGVSPDRQHREEGVAVVTSLSLAAELAWTYGQSALFWYDGTSMWLVGVRVAHEPVRLPNLTQPTAI
jgi:hypothetical protein